MAINTSYNYSVGGGFTNSVLPGDRVYLSTTASGDVGQTEVGAYQENTVIVDTGINIFLAANNTKYISPTEVSLNGASTVILSAGNVTQADATFRIDWEDDTGTTTLTNVKYFFYDAVTPAIAPVGVSFVAFERTAGAIRQGHVEGVDTLAWDDSDGVNGSANALDMADSPSSTVHSFFVGLSGKPTAFGSKTAIKSRISFDVA